MEDEKKRELLGTELELIQECLGSNPKIYVVWYHRKWILQNFQALLGPSALERDLKLCGKLLLLDDRNFHCWGYRNLFLAPLAALTLSLYEAFGKQLVANRLGVTAASLE